jgi:hypothetical protein
MFGASLNDRTAAQQQHRRPATPSRQSCRFGQLLREREQKVGRRRCRRQFQG